MALTQKDRIAQLEAENAQLRAQIADLTEALLNVSRAVGTPPVVTVRIPSPAPVPSPHPCMPTPYPWTTICQDGMQTCTTQPDGMLLWNMGAN